MLGKYTEVYKSLLPREGKGLDDEQDKTCNVIQVDVTLFLRQSIRRNRNAQNFV